MRIVIPGDPIPQGRMRHATWGGHGHLYDPNAKDKVLVRKHLSANYQHQHYEYPEVSFIFGMPIPASMAKWMQLLCRSQIVRHTKKPDVDNLVKFYLDVMDGIVFTQDSKVSLGYCVKIYAPYSGVVAVIRERQQVISCDEVDAETWQGMQLLASATCPLLSPPTSTP